MYAGSLQVPPNDPARRSVTVRYSGQLNSEHLSTMTVHIYEFVPNVTLCVGQTSTPLIPFFGPCKYLHLCLYNQLFALYHYVFKFLTP